MTSSPLRRLFYVSRTPPGVDARMVSSIVATSRRLNRRQDITGALAYSGDYFAQVLEGRAEDLASLLQKIRRDPRQRDLTVVIDQPISRRDYGDWSMGFLYDAGLSQELEAVLRATQAQTETLDDTLPRRIFAHISDPASP